MKRFLILLACTVGLAGCAGMPGGDAVTAAVGVASDVLTGPDTDYKNYLSHCRAEVKEQAEAAKADSQALQAALTSGNDKTQYGATLIMAFKAALGGPKIGCSAQRKKGTAELLLGESDLLDKGLRLYEINRDEKRFKRQLDADADLAKQRLNHERQMADRQNDLLTTLSGDKLELQRDAREAAAD